MNSKHNKEITPLAKKLRKNMTREERHLWYDFLRTYPVRFLRQKVIGSYIVDFYCSEAKLAIELDGSQHYDAAAADKDEKRSAFIRQYDIDVLRIPNNEVMGNFRGVCEYIHMAVQGRLSK